MVKFNAAMADQDVANTTSDEVEAAEGTLEPSGEDEDTKEEMTVEDAGVVILTRDPGGVGRPWRPAPSRRTR